MRFLLALLFVISATFATAQTARANTCTVPNSLSNGAVVDANVLNTNFVSLQSCGNNIDSTNIGPAGILASQIIASSAAAGTFGGTFPLGFPHGINYAGTINASSGEASFAVNGAPLLQSLAGNAYVRSPGVNGTVFIGDSATPARYGNFGPTGFTAATQIITPTMQVQGGTVSGTSAIATSLSLTNGLSSQYPTLNNSGDGGFNSQVAAASVNGHRWFAYDGTTLTLLAQLTNAGVFSVVGNSQIGGNLQIGANAPGAANFISRGMTGTFPYDATVYSSTDHLEHWNVTATTTGVMHTFAAPYSTASSYHCFLQARGSYSSGALATNAFSTTSVTVFVQSGTQSVDAFCIGF